MELFTPEFGLVFWMFLVFVILFVILAKYAWPAIMKSVDERADFIDKGVSYAQEAKVNSNTQPRMLRLSLPKLSKSNSKFSGKPLR